MPYDDAYVEQYYRYSDDDGRRFMSGDISAAGLTGGGYDYVWKGVRRIWRVPEKTMERLDEEGRIFYTRNGIPRIKRYLDESRGLAAPDVWTDIEALRSWHKEKLRYPTQKPKALLERLIEAFTDEDDLVLDPFCGCGTTVDAAHGMNRRWIGIDITYIAIDLIRVRLEDAFMGEADFAIDGIPRDLDGARALFTKSPFDFERWAVSLVNGQPNEKQVGDEGADGVIRFPIDKKQVGKVLISVKGGAKVGPAMVREIVGTVNTRGAQMGVLITTDTVTPGMEKAANHAGNYEWLVNGQHFPRIQVVTVEDLLGGKRLDMPPALNPYLTAPAAGGGGQQLGLLTQQGVAPKPVHDELDDIPPVLDDEEEDEAPE